MQSFVCIISHLLGFSKLLCLYQLSIGNKGLFAIQVTFMKSCNVLKVLLEANFFELLKIFFSFKSVNKRLSIMQVLISYLKLDIFING